MCYWTSNLIHWSHSPLTPPKAVKRLTHAKRTSLKTVFSSTEKEEKQGRLLLSLYHTHTLRREKGAMPEETTSIDYVMEAASGPHFSGLRLDGRLPSSSSSPKTSSPAPDSTLGSDSLPKQPFVIGLFLSLLNFNLNFNLHLDLGFWMWTIDAGVSGGTASGKTTVCDMIIQQLHDHRVVLVNQVYSTHYTSVLFFFWGLHPPYPRRPGLIYVRSRDK